MRGAAGKICAVLLACLLFGQGLSVFAMEEYLVPYGVSSDGVVSAERVCETVDELLAELEKDIGGTIGCSGEGPFVLAAEETPNTWLEITQPVTVHMPESSIEIRTWTSFSGPVTFTGTRGFTVGKDSRLILRNDVSMQMREGPSGEAPIAVSVENRGEVFADSSVTIRADGDNAVAILSNGYCELDLGYAKVSAAGNGAVAIASEGDLIVHEAYVEAQGDDAHAICVAGAAELCLVSSIGVVEANPVYSVISHYTQPPLHLIEVPVEPDKMYTARDVVYQDLAYGCLPVEFSDWAGCTVRYRGLDVQTDPDTLASSFYVEYTPIWDLSGLNYSVPGEYIVPATLRPQTAFPGLPTPTFTHEVTVMPPNRAALYAETSAPGRDDDTFCMAVRCLAPIPDADEILFWVWEDGWREMTATGDAVYAEGWNPSLHPDFDFLEDEVFFQLSGAEYYSYWVVVQVIGGPMEGFSNLRQIFPGADGEGDRSGTDRYGKKPDTLPSGSDVEIVPPEGEIPGGYGEIGGRTSSSGSGGSTADTDKPAPPLPVVETAIVPQDSPLPPAKEDSVEAVGSVVSVENTPTRLLPEEWEDETTIAITGKRLLALLDEPVVFIKNGVRIVVDNDALIALNIQEHQLFTVTLEGSEAGYIARFALDGESVELPYELILPDAPAHDETAARDVPAPADIPSVVTEDVADVIGFPWTGLIVTGAVGVPSLSGGFWLLRRHRRR